MSFPSSVREDALVACARHCCLCHKFCGLKIELHHIDHAAAGGSDAFANCLPVCFDCHADMRSYDHKHPKGTKYTPAELRRHRDVWYEKVKASPGTTYGDAERGQDAVTFRWILISLPFEGVIDFVERHDFGAPFKLARLDALDSFADKSDDPTLEFLDADLEGLRGALRSSLAEFRNYLSTHTWPMHNSDFQAIPREWEDQQPKRFVEVIDRLNDLSRQVVAAYRELVREGRRRLGV